MSIKMDLSDAQMIVAVLRMESDLTRSLEDVKLLREELQRRLGVKTDSAPAAPAAPASAPAQTVDEPAPSSASTSTEGSKKKRGPKPRAEMTAEEVAADKAKRAAKKAERAAKKAEEAAKPALPVSDGEETEPEEGEIVEEKPKPAKAEKPPKAATAEKPKKEKKAKDPDAPKKAASAGVLAWNAFKEGIRAELKAKDPEAKIKSEDVMKVAKERKDADKAAYEAFVAKYKAEHPSAPASSASSVAGDE